MLGFRIQGLWRVHVWVHRKWELEPVSAPHNRLCHEIEPGGWLIGTVHQVSGLAAGTISGWPAILLRAPLAVAVVPVTALLRLA